MTPLGVVIGVLGAIVVAVVALLPAGQVSAIEPQIMAVCRLDNGNAVIDWEAWANGRAGDYDINAELVNGEGFIHDVAMGNFPTGDSHASGTYDVDDGVTWVNLKIIVEGRDSTSGKVFIGGTPNRPSDCTEIPPPPDPADGWMNGGGSVFMSDGARVTRGFVINCTAGANPGDSIEVNWPGGNNFHTTGDLTTQICTDDPAIAQPPPPHAGFDTFVGIGPGKLNNVEGARIEFVFVDAGEPGDMDTASIQIYDENGILVLDVSGFMDRGNLQTHTHK